MIRYVIGDATEPQREGADERAFIAHICNDVGAWGAGFVVAISRRWSSPRADYIAWHETSFGAGASGHFALGEIQVAVVSSSTAVVNMVAQRGFPTAARPCAVDFMALEGCLNLLADEVLGFPGGAVHMPRIGCGIAGASWEDIEPIIERTLCARGVPVTVYDLPEKH